MLRYLLGVMLLVPFLACSDDGTGPQDNCNAMTLPLSGDPDGPVVTAVSIELIGSSAVVAATATDPQESENLAGVLQSIAVFEDRLCNTQPIVIQDMIESGVPESFGPVATTADNAPLYTAIAASLSWPVEVEFKDLDGHTTMGRVRATIPR